MRQKLNVTFILRLLTIYLICTCIAIPALAISQISCEALFAAPNPRLIQLFIAPERPLGADFFSPWSPNNSPKLKSSQFLPTDFVKKINNEVGPISIDVLNLVGSKNPIVKVWDQFNYKSFGRANHSRNMPKGYQGFKIQFIVGKIRTFIKVTIWIDPDHPDKAIITGLRLENPLAKDSKNLHESQSAKGLPFPVFSHLKHQFLSFLKAGSFREVGTDGSQNYLVSLLYRRMVNLKPVAGESENFYNYVDYLFNLTRKGPEALRLNSIYEFSELLGSAHEPSTDFLNRENIWKKASEDGTASEILEPIYDKDRLIGVVDREAIGLQQKFYFIDPNNGGQFFHWSRYLSQSILQGSLYP